MTTSKALFNLSRWPLFLTYTFLLYIAYTLSPDQMPAAVLRANDKLMHFLDFFLLALLAFRTFIASSRPIFEVHAGGKAAFFSLSYGAFLEWVQRNVAGREASYMDWLADALGVFAAVMIFRISKLPHGDYPDPWEKIL